MKNRNHRSILFFGKEGQNLINGITVVIVGIGGLGTHVIQQLALLGVSRIILIDDEILDLTNLNRYVGVGPEDVGKRKVDLGERLIKSIRPEIVVEKCFASIRSIEGLKAAREGDYIFGCVDNEGARLIITDISSRNEIPLIDLASDILTDDGLEYGGRVFFSDKGEGCLFCMGLIDIAEAQEDLMNDDARRDRDEIYGVRKEFLERSGPSVVSINGIIASLGVTEFMVDVAKIRVPKRLLEYFGSKGTVSCRIDAPDSNCYYCKSVRGVQDGEAEQMLLDMSRA